MMFEAGGNQYTAAPFAGWYQSTEVSTRDLLDPQRYNLLEEMGVAMKLDMTSNVTLWKDTVALELNKAVLESYKNAGVSIVDQYTQAEQFMEHMQAEYKSRGGCPADWVWIVPPSSGSLVPTFHQEMLRYYLSPSYEYQDKPWHSHGKAGQKFPSLYTISWIVLYFRNIHKRILSRRKTVSILYGTETGASSRFAEHALDVLS